MVLLENGQIMVNAQKHVDLEYKKESENAIILYLHMEVKGVMEKLLNNVNVNFENVQLMVILQVGQVTVNVQNPVMEGISVEQELALILFLLMEDCLVADQLKTKKVAIFKSAQLMEISRHGLNLVHVPAVAVKGYRNVLEHAQILLLHLAEQTALV